MAKSNGGASIAQERIIFGTLEGAGRPLDFLELQKKVGSKMTASELPRVLKTLVSRKTIEQTTREGEVLPVYSLNLFKTSKSARGAKKSRAARAPVSPGKPRVTARAAVKVAPKVRVKFGALGTKTQKICSVRTRDVATGRLLPGCKHPSGYIFAPDGTRVRVKVTSCGEDGQEAFTYKVLSAEFPDDLKAALRKAPKEEREAFKISWLEVLEEELNASTAADIGGRELMREIRSDRSQRAVRTRAENAAAAVKAGKPKAGSADKPRALNELEAVKARIGAAKLQAQKTKSEKRLGVIKRRVARLEKAAVQLGKIAAGKASKFPSAAQLK